MFRSFGTVLAIGALDGLHLGHQKIIEAVVARARETGATPAVLTFDPHPLAVLRGKAPPRITLPDDRLRILRSWGIEHVEVLRPTRRLLALSPQAFLARVARRLRPVCVVVGSDFRFGRNRAGTPHTILRAGIPVEVVPPVRRRGGVVSSTRIRRALATGRLAEARELLGRDVAFRLRPERGAGRGRREVVPTLNFPVPTEALARGVYAGTVAGRKAVLHLGARPTFGDAREALEAFLLESSPPRGRGPFEVIFLRYLRGTRRFPSAAALRTQIHHDAARARKILARALGTKR